MFHVTYDLFDLSVSKVSLYCVLSFFSSPFFPVFIVILVLGVVDVANSCLIAKSLRSIWENNHEILRRIGRSLRKPALQTSTLLCNFCHKIPMLEISWILFLMPVCLQFCDTYPRQKGRCMHNTFNMCIGKTWRAYTRVIHLSSLSPMLFG